MIHHVVIKVVAAQLERLRGKHSVLDHEAVDRLKTLA